MRGPASGTCRSCRANSGHLVLDLGRQPACDYFPAVDDPGPDPLSPLQMWLCSQCGLAQLAADGDPPAEPLGTEPAALVAQAADAVRRVDAFGLLRRRETVAEYGSPHGGSWLGLLADYGLQPVAESPAADLVVDVFGMMHAPDQAAAAAQRAARVAPGGVLLVQYHPLATIIGRGQWNTLRHGHYAYYSTTVLVHMLAVNGFAPMRAWQFDLYGGTVLLAAGRQADGHRVPDWTVRALLAADARIGIADPAVLTGLQVESRTQADLLRAWLASQLNAGRTVVGYGAASRAVALLRLARIDRSLLPAIVDAAPGKHGSRMPGTDIPIVGPAQLAALRPDEVLLFLPDLRSEVRAAFPEVEEAGGRWVEVEQVGSSRARNLGCLQQQAEPVQAPAASRADAADR